MKKLTKRAVISLVLVLSMVLSFCTPLADVLGLNLGASAALSTNFDQMSFETILSYNDSLTWVIAGDSITHNGGWSQGANSYGEWIEQYLQTIGRSSDSVVLSGWGGAKLEHYQPGYTKDVGMGTDNFITKYNPDVVTIKLGMNNRPMGEADFKELYGNILDEVYRAGAENGKVPKIVMLSSTPVAGENEYDLDVPGQDSVYRQVQWLKDIQAEYNAAGKNIAFVDLRNGLVAERNVLGDDYYQTFFFGPSDGAIHPNAAGQYAMFKIIAKTLGFYDASMPIFNHDYADLNEDYMYVDSTYISDYTGDYGLVDSDVEQMNSEMPVLDSRKQPELLASADFTSSNGKFGADSGEVRYVDLMNDAVMTDKLTGDEVKAMGKEYSVVFRAKLENSDFDFINHSVALYMSANKASGWSGTSTLMVSFPGKHATNGYYGDGNMASGANVKYGNVRTAAMDGKWHTFAVVQSETKLVMYVDGVAYDLNTNFYLKQAIGTYFASAVEAGTFEALFGSYGSASPDSNYGMDGWVDYVQLYNGALNADEMAYLTENSGAASDDSEQMNKTMPALSGVDTMASIEFTSTTGTYKGDNGNLIDMTDSSVTADPFTFAEAQSLKKSYSVVLRAKLEQGGNANAGILLLSGNGTSNWQNALTVGVPSKSYQTWNRVMQNNAKVASPDGQLNINTGTTPAGDGQWHTLAITVSDTTHSFYLDGTLVSARDMSCSIDLGDLFTAEDTFAARFGRYSDNDGGSFTLKGSLDYFQFYGQTLTADQVAELSSGYDAEQMNAVMPTLPEQEQIPNVLASVDFTSENGEFVYNNSDINASTLDLTVAAEGVDTLTVAEAQTLGKEYTIVFHAKTEPHSSRVNHPIIYLAGTSTGGFGAQSDKVLMGMPGTSNIFYQVTKNGSAIATVNGATENFGSLRTQMNNGEWHTVAIVQSTSGLTYYVDGTAYEVKTNGGAAITLNSDIGSMFNDVAEADFDAVIGRYGITDGNWKTQGDFDYWTLYDGALTSDQIAYLTENSGVEDVSPVSWSDMDTNNSVWAIAGGQQMIGYQGSVANRSLLRLIENTARNGSGWTNRDIRILPFATAGYDPEYLVDNYDAIFGGHAYNVFMLLPEVPDVYAAGYVHSDALVAAYKADIEALLTKNTNKVKVLWSPLASNDDTVNTYITAYAEAVRQIAAADNTILFFDANKFMNERMAANASLKRNWFEEGMNISPLCALDVTCAFYAHANVASLLVSQEMKHHNLRLSTDNRPLKDTVRDYIVPGVTVSGSSITVDASGILTDYPDLSNLRVAVLSATGVGSDHKDNWEDIAYFGSGSTVTFTAPWSNAVVTVIGDMNGYSYRFKDVTTNAVAETQTVEHYTDNLTALEVVGAPAIGFDPATTTYNVELYQYQRNVQILAQGGDNLSITVNGEKVEAGAYSQKIAVDKTATVEVKVTGGAGEKTYTLNLTRPDDADIIITEVMYASTGATYDLIEIYNASGKELNLLDYAIGYKKDYTDSVYTTENKGMYPYYFTGDDQAFNSRNGSTQTYTGINEITKNSSFWSGEDVVAEPDYIAFPADSTMILWVKFGGASATYSTLVSTLENSSTTYTLADGTKVVPSADIVAIAERPNGVTKSGAQSTGYGALPPAETSFHLEDHNTLVANDSESTRSWMFILKDGAVRDDNASITEAGNDIISASMLVRPTNSFDMSTVLYYDYDRGMALAKNPVSFDADETDAPYYSSEYSYANYTSFGAIEYWQKPYDLADALYPTAEDKTPAYVVKGTEVTIDLTLKDDSAEKDDAKGDVRYFELYVKKAGETEYTKVAAKDFVLEAGVKNKGVSADQPSIAYTYDLGELTEAASYYYVVTDGNNHTTQSDYMTVNVVEANALNVDMTVTDARGNDAANVTADVKIELTKGENTADLAESYTVTLGGKEYTTVNGAVTIPMANDDSISIAGLPAGTAYTVTVAAPEGYTAAQTTSTGTIAADAASGVSLAVQADKKNADLTVKMDIDKYYGEAAAASVEAQVKISVTTDSAANHDLTGTYSTSVDGVSLAKDGDAWTATVALSDAETIVINDLPVGAKYTLTVTPAEGYANVTTVNNGAVAEGGTEVTWSVKQKAPETGTLKVNMTVDDTTAHNVTITVTKGQNMTHDLNGTYDIVNAGNEKIGTLTKNGDAWTATVSMKNGETASVTLPQGTSYTVALEDKENYTESAAATGTIGTGESTASMQATREEGSLEVSFSADDYKGNASTAAVSGTVTITISDTTGSYDVMVGGTKTAAIANGTATFSLANGNTAKVEGLLAGTTYTVSYSAPNGYTDTTTGQTLSGSIVKGTASRIAFTAQENTPTEADLKLTLTADDTAAHGMTITVVTDKAGTYAVTNAEGAQIAAFVQDTEDTTKYVATLTGLANGWEGWIRDLPVGATYTIAPAPTAGYQDNSTAAQLSGTVGTEDGAVAVSIGKVAAGSLKVTMSIVDSKGQAVSGVEAKAVIELANVEAEHASIVTGKGFTYDAGKQTYSRELTLENGGSETISGLPEGVTYTVATTKLDGYEEPTVTGATGTIAKNAESTVTVTHKKLAPAVGDLTVTLTAEDTAKQTVTITVTPASGKTLDASYTVEAPTGVTVNQNGTDSQWTATVELSKDQSVTVKELPDGASYSVSVADKAGYHTPAVSSGTIADGQTETVTLNVTNVASGSLEVSLSAVDYKGGASNAEFSVEIVLSDTTNSYNVAVGEKTVATTNGKATVTLKNGEKATVAGLPVDTTYSVNLTTPNGFSNVTTAATSGTIAENTKSSVALSVTQNTPELEDLSVTMSVKGEDGITADTTAEATVQIALTGNLLAGDYDLTVGSDTVKLNAANGYTAEVKLNDGETAVVKDVPAGTGYTVNVAAPAGYELTTAAQFTGSLSGTTAPIAPGVKKSVVITGDLNITLEVKDNEGSVDTETEVTANIELFVNANAAVLSGTYDIVDARGTKLGEIKAGSDGKYVGSVTLKNGEAAYVKDVPVGVNYKITLTVPDTHENKTETSVLNGVVSSADGAAIALKVEQKQPKVGGLKVTMAVTDRDGAADTTTKAAVSITLTGEGLADSYEIKDASGNKIGTITKSGTTYTGTVNLGNGGEARIQEIPAGTQFTAKVTVPDGFTAKTETTISGAVVENAYAVAALSIQEKAPVNPGPGETDPDGPSGGETDPTDKPEETTKPTETGKPADGSPNTGEDVRVVLWLWMALAAAAAGVATVLYKRRTTV